MVRWFWMRLAITATLVGVSIVACVIACSSSPDRTPNGPAPATDGGPDASDAAAPLPYPLDQVCAPSTDPSLEACGRCARDSCCNTRARLLGTDAGNALIDCLQKPSCEAPCQGACFDGAPDETAPFLEHYTCLTHRCPDCGARSTCTDCLQAHCLRESVACDLSRDCFVISSCITACRGVDACITDCGKRYPGAGPLNGQLLVCATNLCSRECQ